MTINRMIRRISIWWWTRRQVAKLDPKARERHDAIVRARKAHRPVKPLYEAQRAGMTAKLMKECENG